MSRYVIIVVFIVFIALIINLPVFIIKLIAKVYKVKLSYKETWNLYKFKLANKSFFKSVAKFQENHIPVSVEKMVAHQLAGGNLDNCVEGLIFSKENNLNADFQTVSVIDLLGKNVKESFSDANKIYEITLNELKNGDVSIDYFVNYKYEFPSVFIEKDCGIVREKIERKLHTFLESWKGNDIFETEQMIRKNILNTDFWEGNLKIILIKQNFVIRKI